MNRLPVCPQRDGDRLARRGSGVEWASSILRASGIRMGSSVQANDLPRGLFGVVADQEGSDTRRAWLTRLPDSLGVRTSGDLSGDLLIPNSPLCAAS
jgi:hypothetical protein